ncbi:putative Diguanylate cyclase [Syntrophobacter sp. SbD1]|nr:putative Diguanylate cyclase [Syntrophobacter sp. SbD1]
MNSQHDSDSLTGRTERLCETVIDALHELRSATSEPVTPSLLSQSLIKHGSYLDVLNATARSAGLQGDSLDIEPYAGQLQQFQLEILRVFRETFSEATGPRPEELSMLVRKAVDFAGVLQLNGQILDFITEASDKVSIRQKDLVDLISELTRNLVEVENFVTASYSDASEVFRGSKAFAETLENNVREITASLQTTHSTHELKSLITSKLEGIKEKSRKKLQADAKQLMKLAGQVKELKSQLKSIRTQISKAHRRAEQMEQVSLLDTVTGIANRRAYQKYIREKWAEYKLTKGAFSILMVDVDNFKSINDLYGHWTGDKCLAQLAKRLKVNLRGTDFLARCGGDEFIIVLPETEAQGAETVAQKMCEHVQRTRFLFRGERITLTISIGVSTVNEADQNIKSTFERADRGLYKTKENGRNCVSVIL